MKCLYGLRKECRVLEIMIEKASSEEEKKRLIEKWGTDEWVKIHCAMCVKSLYAKAKFRLVSKYSVVNTL